MHFVFYTHSLVSDWNHGNAHFLRGVMRELIAAGHTALALEPEDGWSRRNLVADAGPAAIARFHADFPLLHTRTYGPGFDHEAALDGADVVIVHEWTDPALVQHVATLRRSAGFTLLFHDTHHRAVSAGDELAALDLTDFDGVLVFGATLKDSYQRLGWGRRVHVWHEAADTALFRPRADIAVEADLVWIGNWGDDERTAELSQFLFEPAERLGLTGHVHGVRYPPEALARIGRAGLHYAGWLPNARVPEAFASHRLTVHVPRRPYVESLPGIPTIRMFEALACGIPLISAPWDDCESLFRPGRDFLFARNGEDMQRLIGHVLNEPDRAAELSRSGRETVLARHTCRHRVEELLALLAQDYGLDASKREAAQ